MDITFNADVPAQNYVQAVMSPTLGLGSEKPRETQSFTSCNNALNELSG